MKNAKLVIISIVTTLMMAGCSLDYSPVSNPSELTVGSSSDEGSTVKYKDRAAMLAQYESLYQTMKDRQEHWYLDYLLITEARSDNAYAGTTGAEVVPFETNSIDASNSVIERDWDRYLADIALANTIICNIDSVPDATFEQSERNQWKAEAKIFRAMMMFDMVRFFGNFPVITTEAPDITADNIDSVYPYYYPSASTPAEAYTQIIKDLTEAIPSAPALDQSDKTKLSKTVAYALLAKVYAEKPMRDYDKVIAYADSVEADGIELDDNYSDLFAMNAAGTDAKMRNSKESILEIQYFTGGGNWVTWMFGRDLIDYNSNFTWAKWVTPSRDLINAFDEEGDSIRKNQSIVYYECTWANYYSMDHYPFMYKCRSAVSSIIKLRGADIMLLKAEALANENDLSDAADIVDKIRARVNLAGLSNSVRTAKDKLLDAILHERRLELAFEGQRYFDLIRDGELETVMNSINSKDSGRLAQERTFDDNCDYLPIPQSALDENDNLVQNLGY